MSDQSQPANATEPALFTGFPLNRRLLLIEVSSGDEQAVRVMGRALIKTVLIQEPISIAGSLVLSCSEHNRMIIVLNCEERTIASLPPQVSITCTTTMTHARLIHLPEGASHQELQAVLSNGIAKNAETTEIALKTGASIDINAKDLVITCFAAPGSHRAPLQSWITGPWSSVTVCKNTIATVQGIDNVWLYEGGMLEATDCRVIINNGGDARLINCGRLQALVSGTNQVYGNTRIDKGTTTQVTILSTPPKVSTLA